MDQQTKQQNQVSSSMQSGSAESINYEYWLEKSSGKIYACRTESGVKQFHGPISEAQSSISPEGLTYTTNEEILSRPDDFTKLTYSEVQEKFKNKSQGVGSSSS